MNDFCVGERVVCIVPSVFAATDECGTVVFVDRDIVGVRWDSYHIGRHSCGGLCEEGHGWNMNYKKLQHVYDNAIEFDDSDADELMSLVSCACPFTT